MSGTSDEKGGFFEEVYGLDDAGDTRRLYDRHATGYDAEVRASGYVSPRRSAEALAGLLADRATPILDLGCGTGLSGEAFRDAGFTVLDGTDFSAEMLAVAEGKGIYRRLTKGDLHEPIPAAPGAYSVIAAIGVFSPGHAPAEMIDTVLDLLPPGGLFVFTLNDHALEEQVYEARTTAAVEGGRAEIAFNEYGEHLTARAIGSRIYVLKRL